jgi:hypothetical protein
MSLFLEHLKEQVLLEQVLLVQVLLELNTLKTGFLYSKRLVNVDHSKVLIDSVDATIETSRLIDRSKFDSIAKTLSISQNILEIKTTDSTDVSH